MASGNFHVCIRCDASGFIRTMRRLRFRLWIVRLRIRLNIWLHTGWRGYLWRMWKYPQ